jgi:condensin-2 complex subunit D3
VDKFIPTIALSLRDPNDTVRRQTLMLLSRLLQEDFLKWKTTLFYRFILALVDDNIDVQQSGI